MLRTLNLGSGLVFLALLATFATAQQTRVQVDTGVPLPDFQPDAAYLLSTLHIDHLDAGTPENPVDTCMIREGCLAGYGNRTVVRFGTMIWNRGPGDAFLGEFEMSSRRL